MNTVLQVWNRLSSLQRSVICLFVLLGIMCAIYIVPSLYRDDTDGNTKEEFLERRRKMKPEERDQLELLKDKRDKLDALKRKAKQQVQNLMVYWNYAKVH